MAKIDTKTEENIETELPLVQGHHWTGCKEDSFLRVEPENYYAVLAQIEDKIMDKMKNYFVAMEHGKMVVVEEKFSLLRDLDGNETETPELVMAKSEKELAAFYKNKPMWIPELNEGKQGEYVTWKKVNFVTHWFNELDRPSYKEIVFEPYPYGEQKFEDLVKLKTGVDVYNRFKGFPVTPDFDNPDGCKLIKQHLLNVICAGDPTKYAWLMSWFALKVQVPQKIGTTPVMMGPEGCGKGTVASRVFGRIIGRESFVHLGNVQALIGRFTALKDTTLLTYLDEAIFSRNPEQAARLKTLISEEKMTVESKFKDAKTIVSYSDYIIATNALFSAPAEETNRRYVVFDCDRSALPKDTREYFTALNYEIDNGGIESFYGFLLDWEQGAHTYETTDENRKPILAVVDPKVALKTNDTIDQILLNMTPLQEWWHNVLTSGSFGQIFEDIRDEETLSWDDAHRYVHIPKDALFNAMRHYVKSRRPDERLATSGDLFKYLQTICPSIQPGKKPTFREGDLFFRISKGTRPICVDIPSLEQARKEWEDRLNIKLDWETGRPLDNKDDDKTVPDEVFEARSDDVDEPTFIGKKTGFDENDIPF